MGSTGMGGPSRVPTATCARTGPRTPSDVTWYTLIVIAPMSGHLRSSQYMGGLPARPTEVGQTVQVPLSAEIRYTAGAAPQEHGHGQSNARRCTRGTPSHANGSNMGISGSVQS